MVKESKLTNIEAYEILAPSIKKDERYIVDVIELKTLNPFYKCYIFVRKKEDLFTFYFGYSQGET
ncbi:MAG: hypothetical protein ACFNYQ_12425, partial [Treponema sp.]|uniref:hypothetical protein n=1 Tax=Treponema sp. TaxID=166 RepID=UPI0036117E5E